MSERLDAIEQWARGGFLRQGQDRAALERDVLALVEIARCAQVVLASDAPVFRHEHFDALRAALARLDATATEQP